MEFSRTGKYSFVIVCWVCLSMVVCKYNLMKDRDPNQPVSINWDVYGYYMHLPNTFIYGDVGMTDKKRTEEIQSKYHTTPYLYQAADGIEGRKVNVYPIGLAIAYAPGFFIAHMYAKISGYPADGYSSPYQWSLVISGFVFAFLGVFMSRKILLHFFDDTVTAVVMLLLLLGTNYFYQCGLDGTMPHNFLFTLSCFILWLTIKWHEEYKMKHAMLLGLLIGWATVTRPTELLWVLIPLLWGVKNRNDLRERISLFRREIKQVSIFVCMMILVGIPQLVYWKYTSGHWMSNNHSESFSFLDPYTYKFLFSFKKGWLIYTPIMTFALIGFISLYRSKRELFYPILIFTVLNIYILSSWECWWYASSFSQRPVVESYCLLMLPLGFFVRGIFDKKVLLRYALLSVLSLLMLLNIFQTWQFCNGIFDGERMTFAYYMKVFGHRHVPDGAAQYLEVNRYFPNGEKFAGNENDYLVARIMNQDFEGSVDENRIKNVCDTFSYEGKKSFRLDSAMTFSPGMNEAYGDLCSKYFMWVRVSAYVYPLTSPDTNNFALVIDMNKHGNIYKYTAFEARKLKLKPRQWNKIEVDYLTPEIRHTSDQLEIYFWNIDKGTVFLDSFNAEVLIPKKTY